MASLLHLPLLVHCDDAHRPQVEGALSRLRAHIVAAAPEQAELVVLAFSPERPFPLTEAPILALVQPDQEEDALRAGAWDVLVLPIRPAVLAARAQGLIEGVAQRQARERAEQELQDFLRVASHDLAAPLRTVLMYIDLLSNLHADALDDDGQRVLERTQSAAWVMHEMILGLLDLSRTISRPLAPGPQDLQAMVTAALVQLAHLREGAELHIGALPVVICDGHLMGRVIKELLDNALKFRAGGPHLVSLHAGTDEAGLWLEVRDNGVGMPEGHRDKVLQPFGRLHGRSEFPGHGLGLAVAERAVRRMGGTLSIHSTLGEGTCARVQLPVEVMDDDALLAEAGL